MKTEAWIILSMAGVVASVAAGYWHPRLWLGLTLAGAAGALGAAIAVLAGGGDWEWKSHFALAGQTAHLHLDALSAIFLTLLGVTGATGAAYGHEYWSQHDHPDSAPRGRVWWSAMMLSMTLLLVSRNGLHFLIAWEAFAISGYFLIALDRRRPEARAAGWLYFGASHAGTLCLFAFFAALAARTGSWELGPMRGASGLSSLYWLALAGFGVKAGLFPLHIWLPSAHANAPSHVSALMSGLAIKMGVYGIIRFAGWLTPPAGAGWALVALGGLTAVLGIAFAFVQNDFKRLLAYCSVENVGIIAIGTGGAVLALTRPDAAWGRLLLAGALLHVWNHGLFKSLLFFAAGSVLHATGTREMSRLGGLWRRMRWTTVFFALGAVAVSGLPPLNGFISEWLIYIGLFDASAAHGAAAWAAGPATIALAVAGAISLATFTKAGAVIFLGSPRTHGAEAARECGPWMRGAMLAPAAACLALGFAPVIFWPALGRAVGAWNPAWSAVYPPSSLAILGLLDFGLAAAFIGAGAWLWHQAAASAAKRAPTWGCGYSFPTPRLQYTSGSFAGIFSQGLGWIFLPRIEASRPRGPFPLKARSLVRVPDLILDRVIGPAAAGVLRISQMARRLQHGRVQSYIVYLAGGLAGLALLVMQGCHR